jgi:hypothetical protein
MVVSLLIGGCDFILDVSTTFIKLPSPIAVIGAGYAPMKNGAEALMPFS